MFWTIVVIGAIIAILIHHANDRKANPEKWKAFDLERAAARERKAEKEYQEAIKRVPPSIWMRMSRSEKADVLERREKAEKNRSGRT